MFHVPAKLLAMVLLLGAMTVPASADKLYVSDWSLFTVNSYDASTGAFLGELLPPGGWGLPAGIAVAADGRIYVVDSYNQVIQRFSAAGTFLDTFVSSGLDSPSAIAFGPDGNLYVVSTASGSSYISRFDASGALVPPDPFVPSTVLDSPMAIAFGTDSNLYIANSQNGSLDKVALPSGTFSNLVGPGCPAAPFANPFGIAFGPDGNLYVADAGNGCGGGAVYKFTTAGALLGTFVAGNALATPIGVAFGPDGNFYAVDSLARVAKFNGSTGAYISDLVPYIGSTGSLFNPYYLAFSKSAGAKLVVQSGSGQTTLLNTQFSSPLVAKVTDLAGNPVEGVTVTFTAPAQTGASATFAGGVNTAVTNAAGIATSAAVTANGFAGSYNVVASAGGAPTVNFALTNSTTPPAVNVSSSISVTHNGFVANRNGLRVATMTVTNIGGAAIAGPIHVIFTNLPGGITMANATGTSGGNPYITVTGGTLGIGASVQVSIQFNGPLNTYITFTPVTMSGVL